MALPKTKVPTRAQWQTLRDKSGGKKGLAKVSIGKSLDKFHATLAKASKTDDVKAVTDVMASLEKDLNTYAAAVQKKYNELASTVKREMISPLKAYKKALSDIAAKAYKELNRIENELRNLTNMAIKEGDKMAKEMVGMNKEYSGMQKKYNDGVPEPDKKDVTRFVKDAAGRAKNVKTASKLLDKELNDFVAKYLRDHRPLIKKHNSTLGKAKGSVKSAADGGQKAEANAVVMAQLLKK